MNILRLPPNTQMYTRLHYRSIDNSIYAPPCSVFPQNVLDRIDNWFELTVSDISQFKTLITEIDLSSNNRFYTYTRSDLDWLLYCEPNRVKIREPQNGDVVEVSIEDVFYKAVIEIPYFSCTSNRQDIKIKANIVLP